MMPFLSFLGLRVPAYGLCILLGIVLGACAAAFAPARRAIPRQDLLFLSCFGGIGAFVGAKLLYFVTILPAIIENWEAVLGNLSSLPALLFQGGFVFYGGVLGGVSGIAIYTRRYRIPLADALDGIAPSIPLIHAFGRLGCFMAGCCYGIPAPAPFGVSFDPSPFAPHGVLLFPVQLLEAALNLLLFAVLFLFSRKSRVPGNTMLLYLCAYAVERFFLEYLRYDSGRGMFLWFSTSQWISAGILVFCAAFCLRRAAKGRSAQAQ